MTEKEDNAAIEHFAFLYREYGLAADDTLAPDALALKARVLSVFGREDTFHRSFDLVTRIARMGWTNGKPNIDLEDIQDEAIGITGHFPEHR